MAFNSGSIEDMNSWAIEVHRNLNESATKIQAAFRGYSTRARLRIELFGDGSSVSVGDRLPAPPLPEFYDTSFASEEAPPAIVQPQASCSTVETLIQTDTPMEQSPRPRFNSAPFTNKGKSPKLRDLDEWHPSQHKLAASPLGPPPPIGSPGHLWWSFNTTTSESSMRSEKKTVTSYDAVFDQFYVAESGVRISLTFSEKLEWDLIIAKEQNANLECQARAMQKVEQKRAFALQIISFAEQEAAIRLTVEALENLEHSHLAGLIQLDQREVIEGENIYQLLAEKHRELLVALHNQACTTILEETAIRADIIVCEEWARKELVNDEKISNEQKRCALLLEQKLKEMKHEERQPLGLVSPPVNTLSCSPTKATSRQLIAERERREEEARRKEILDLQRKEEEARRKEELRAKRDSRVIRVPELTQSVSFSLCKEDTALPVAASMSVLAALAVLQAIQNSRETEPIEPCMATPSVTSVSEHNPALTKASSSGLVIKLAQYEAEPSVCVSSSSSTKRRRTGVFPLKPRSQRLAEEAAEEERALRARHQCENWNVELPPWHGIGEDGEFSTQNSVSSFVSSTPPYSPYKGAPLPMQPLPAVQPVSPLDEMAMYFASSTVPVKQTFTTLLPKPTLAPVSSAAQRHADFLRSERERDEAERMARVKQLRVAQGTITNADLRPHTQAQYQQPVVEKDRARTHMGFNRPAYPLRSRTLA
eukprot:TRINITY_DN3647_c0_g1_i1.p1 TRINITY_DN3647_c0_g1~~TRINITY_DN3647_c0_g1_i1.p1  ORF type:complete len:710 (+),score=109.16 TRINITY_DN3647_c0_g1_i1:1076-3205(+)